MEKSSPGQEKVTRRWMKWHYSASTPQHNLMYKSTIAVAEYKCTIPRGVCVLWTPL